MTHRNNGSTMTARNGVNLEGALSPIFEQIIGGGADRFVDALSFLLNTAMRLERDEFLGAGPYERTAERQGHANGFKDRTWKTGVGELHLQVPQVREGGFYPNSLERGHRSERALKLALAEMYVQGVSTRKVAAITQKLCGFEVSSTQVSQAAKELDVILDQWRNRPLGCCRYVILDARYEKVRRDGILQDAAVLVAIGISEDGKRQVLGCSVALSEHEVHWRSFLASLVDRGLCGVQLLVSDAHAGLAAARLAVFGGVPWQRCQFHLQQNAGHYVTRHELRKQVAADIRTVFEAPTLEDAKRQLKSVVEKYAVSQPKLAGWMETNLPEGLTVVSLPTAHRRFLRTTNMLERLNKEIRRRTRVATLFPNEASCLRLVSAVLMEISEDWQAGKVYLDVARMENSEA